MVICHHDDRWSAFVAWQPSDLAVKDTKDKDVSSFVHLQSKQALRGHFVRCQLVLA
jgi:hypothetical protein